MIWKNWITSYFCVKLHGLIAMASFLSGFHISVEQNPEQKNHSPTPLQAWLFGKWVQNKKAQLSVSLFVLLCCLPYVLFADEAWKKIEQSGQLRWGADVSGGAPYVFPAPENPTQIIGFEVEIMDALCQRLGVQAKLVSVQWDQLIPALLREDFDIAFNGVEITPERVSIIDFTIPYYFFSEQISSRYGDDRFKKLEDLYGHRVGTLSTTLAQRILEQHKQSTVVPYHTPV